MTATLVRFVWHSVPAMVGRVFRTLGIALTDGQYLATWPAAALSAPVVAVLSGAILAGTQEQITFTYSLFGLAIFAALAGAGAGVGFYGLLGYVVVDVFSGNRLERYYQPDTLTILQSLSAAAISYVLLATLLVLVPLTALGLREEVTRLLRTDSPAVRQITHTLLVGGMIWAWAQATAFLIRPVWSFHDRSPEVGAINPLQHSTGTLVLTGMVVVIGRGLAEEYAIRHAPSWIESPPVDPGRPARRLPIWAAVPLRSAFLVVLLAGLVPSVANAMVLFLVLLVPLTIQAVSARLAPIAWLADRIPLIVRIGAAAAAAYLIATKVVEPQVRLTSSFFPMLVSVTLSLAVAAILLPNREY